MIILQKLLNYITGKEVFQHNWFLLKSHAQYFTFVT